jgi:hypothetical protein
MFRYFPSQDGPSHIHNVLVTAHYAAEPLYRQYYETSAFRVAGNDFAQLIFEPLLKVTSPLTAEKLLLTTYLVLFFVGFRYLLGSLTTSGDYFALLAGLLAPNWFFYMGFWNFCFSMPLLFLTLGYCLRKARAGWRPGSAILLMAGGFCVYCAHIVSWAVCVLAAAILGLPKLIAEFSKSKYRALWNYALPIVALMPPALLFLAYLLGMKEKSAPLARTFRERLWTVYSFSFLHTISPGDIRLAKIVAALLVVATLGVVYLGVRGRSFAFRSSAVLGVAGALGMLTVMAPGSVGSGGYIDLRLAMYAWIFFSIWLACGLEGLPRPGLNAVAAGLCVLALAGVIGRIPATAQRNREIADFVSLGQNIPPNSTVLSVCLEGAVVAPNPLRHAIGLLPQHGIVDLLNYEALTDYFMTNYRRERSPLLNLGTRSELEAIPPKFDIRRYEQQTQGRVQYIVFLSGEPSAGSLYPEQSLYGSQLSAYSLIASNRLGRLYRRTADHDL